MGASLDLSWGFLLNRSLEMSAGGIGDEEEDADADTDDL